MSLHQITIELGRGLLTQLPSALLVTLAMTGLAAVGRRRRGRAQGEVTCTSRPNSLGLEAERPCGRGQAAINDPLPRPSPGAREIHLDLDNRFVDHAPCREG
jgi:hypothetical protein